MNHLDKVKLMDSGTVLFRADSLENACNGVLNLLSGSKVEETAAGCYTADYSDRYCYSIIDIRVEPCSESGWYAASFREGNRSRFPLWPFPSRKAIKRMESIKNCLESK